MCKKMASTTVEWTRASKKKLQAYILLITFVSLILFALQIIAFRFTTMLLYLNVRIRLKKHHRCMHQIFIINT